MQPPPYCCAILRDAAGRLLLEQRGRGARHAAHRLTCFGGRREPSESAVGCLLRELDEELGWQPLAADCRRTVDLYVDGRLIAWFFRVSAPSRLHAREHGRRLQRLPATALGRWPVSSWHLPVLRAALVGQRQVWISADGDPDGYRRPGV